MFDIIGRRRWFYVFSSVIMIPGLIFGAGIYAWLRRRQ